MNPNQAIDRVNHRISYGPSRFLFGAVLFVGALSAAANPASALGPWQDSQQVPTIDDGLTDEEREFINRPISGMTEKEKTRRDEIINKMKEHLLEIMAKTKGEKKDSKADRRKPTLKKPISRRPVTPPKNGAKLNGEETLDSETPKAEPPERSVPRRPRRTFAPITGEAPDEPEDNYDLPFEQRVYSFGFRDGNYIDLVTTFEMKTGLPVLGMPVNLLGATEPADSVISYISAELTDFRTTLHQINDLLFYSVTPPLYLYYNAEEIRLELDAFKELRSKLPPSRLFTSLEAVEQAVGRDELMDSDIVRVFFTPKSASEMRVFNDLVSSMFGESVLMSPVEGTGLIDYTGRVDILSRIQKYLVKLTGLGEEADLQILPVLYIKPSKALERLMVLVDNVITGASEGIFRGGRTARRGARSSKDDLTPEAIKVLVIADDAHEVLLVRGLAYKVNEIKKILEIIDVPTPRPDFAEPVVVSLEYAQAEIVAEVLDDIMNPAGRRGSIRSSRGGKKGATLPIMTADDETLRVVPDPLRNSLILIGPDEMVAHAQFIIKEVLDKPREDPFQKVPVKEGNAEEIAATVESLLSGGTPGKKGLKLLIMEVVGDDIFMRGEPAMMKVAEELILQLDGQSERKRPKTFVYRPENASPSDIVDFLRLQSASGSQKPKKGGRRKPGSTGVGKFYSDDVRVFFTGTEREWENEILPKIKLFDEELPEDKKGVEFVQVIHANPNDVVSSLNLLFDVGKRKDKSDVRFVPTARGVIVSGAVSGAELADIRGVIELMDANPNDPDAYERRTFKLTYAEPEDVEDAISTMFGRPRSVGGGRKPKGVPIVSGEGIRIALTSSGLIVAAPKEKMPDIAALVAEMDSEVASVVLVQRVLPLANADPVKVETAIHKLYGAGAAGGKRRPQGADKPTKDTIRTTTSSKGIFVIAVEEKMPKIEALVRQMDEDASSDPVLATRFEIMHADAELLAEQLEPMLEVEMASYQPDASGKPKRGAGQALLSIQANSQTHSVYVVAPRPILERAAALISMLDQEADDNQKVHEIYTCVNARADDLADLLNVIYGGGARLPSRTSGGKKPDPRRERDRVLRRLAGGGAGDVEIMPLSGNRAISVSGPREKVDEVLALAGEMDAKSENPDPTTRTFTLLYADVDSVADGIIEMLGEKGRGGARKASDDLDLWDFETGPKRAGDISVWPRYETSSLMVVAPADKMVQIEQFIQECERIADPDNDEFQVPPEPFEFYRPKHLGAYEIVRATRSIMLTVYPNSLPVELDYFDDNVVIKGTRRYFDEVRDLITEYVDTAENAAAVKDIVIFLETPPPNVNQAQVLEMTRKLLRGDMDVEISEVSDSVSQFVGDSIPEIPARDSK